MTDKLNVILDTDIGTDVDDAWALALALCSPEIRLKGITLVHGYINTRAQVVNGILRATNNLHIPVYGGESLPMTDGHDIYWNGGEAIGISELGYDMEPNLVPDISAAEFIVSSVIADPGTIICAIGPLTNVAKAYLLSPDIMSKAKLMLMGGSYEGLAQVPKREHNVRLDPLATDIVFSNMDLTAVGLNVTKQVTIDKDQLDQLTTPFGRYLAKATVSYMDRNYGDFTYMHDPLAIAGILDPSVMGYTGKLSATVNTKGYVGYNNVAGKVRAATTVDKDKFASILQRVLDTF